MCKLQRNMLFFIVLAAIPGLIVFGRVVYFAVQQRISLGLQ